MSDFCVKFSISIFVDGSMMKIFASVPGRETIGTWNVSRLDSTLMLRIIHLPPNLNKFDAFW